MKGLAAPMRPWTMTRGSMARRAPHAEMAAWQITATCRPRDCDGGQIGSRVTVPRVSDRVAGAGMMTAGEVMVKAVTFELAGCGVDLDPQAASAQRSNYNPGRARCFPLAVAGKAG
ncbi:unnamed protein product [Prorocentrum cordatum]|uniref:Uncharacterized protein n=1 Tax=Prorocentrum cordatum TaxID=2364126 RepID=A0ABN9S184_9DINO|nr:unnamed protein product [Polarella glacialis]